MDERRGTDTVLGKALTILRAFGADDHELTFTELQRRTGLSKSTLHRVAGDLLAERLLDRSDGRFRLGGGLFELGMRASLERGLIEVATPFLEDLYERTHEVVHLGLREGDDVVYAAKFGGHRQVRSPSRLGGRMPLHATAIGKALLAYSPADTRRAYLERPLGRPAPRTITRPTVLSGQLDVIAEEGVSYEYEESAVGIVCVAAPVLAPDGLAVAAISVAGPINRFHPKAHASSVHAAASGMAATLARRDRLNAGD